MAAVAQSEVLAVAASLGSWGCVASEKKQLYWIGPGPGLLEDADLLMIVSVFCPWPCPCSCFRRGWAGGDWRTCWKMQRAGKKSPGGQRKVIGQT